MGEETFYLALYRTEPRRDFVVAPPGFEPGTSRPHVVPSGIHRVCRVPGRKKIGRAKMYYGVATRIAERFFPRSTTELQVRMSGGPDWDRTSDLVRFKGVLPTGIRNRDRFLDTDSPPLRQAADTLTKNWFLKTEVATKGAERVVRALTTELRVRMSGGPDWDRTSDLVLIRDVLPTSIRNRYR